MQYRFICDSNCGPCGCERVCAAVCWGPLRVGPCLTPKAGIGSGPHNLEITHITCNAQVESVGLKDSDASEL